MLKLSRWGIMLLLYILVFDTVPVVASEISQLDASLRTINIVEDASDLNLILPDPQPARRSDASGTTQAQGVNMGRAIAPDPATHVSSPGTPGTSIDTPTATSAVQASASRATSLPNTPVPTATRPTATATMTASTTPVPTPTVTPAVVPGMLWGVVSSNGTTNLVAERAAGIKVQVVRFSWKDLEPTEGTFDANAVARWQAQLARLRGAGIGVIAELGFHDPPAWAHAYPNSRYVDQYGDAYDGKGTIDSGDLNLVFNPQMRVLAGRYIAQVFATFGTDFAAVRLGGGRWGELTYPPQTYAGKGNCYWGYDANAQGSNPVGGWRPGAASPRGEAGAFVEWYLNALVGYEGWQVQAVRGSYAGQLMLLFPSWGVRPGQVQEATARNLDGTTSAEVNGELQRGYDFARQIAAISDPKVIVTTTWLDASTPYESDPYPQDWTPIKYLASLAQAHPLHLKLYGENTGQGSAEAMRYAASQMQRYGLIGMDWYCETEIFSGQYATLSDYQNTIAAYSPGG